MFNSVEGAIVLALVVVVAGVIAARRLRVPSTIALLIIGLLLGLIPGLPRVELTPNLILLVFLPPLLFEASFNLSIGALRSDAGLILLLAIPGVLLTAFAMALPLHWLVGMPLGVLLVLGALVAATDPVSVLAIFRDLGAPRRLSTVIEGESLLNDGTAIVLFSIVVGAVTGGSFHLGQGILQFLRVAAGGAVLGLLVGLAASALLRRIDDRALEITITTAVAYGTYLLAESVHVSGVIAVVIAGLILGNLRYQTMSSSTRVALESFWEYVSFLGNALIFLLIGERIVGAHLLRAWRDLALVLVVMLVSRVLIIAAANGVMVFWHRQLPWRWTPLLWWGGVRGAVALALALSLPSDLPHREWVQLMAFGVVLFTLLLEGMTVGPLLRRLGLRPQRPLEAEYGRHTARLQSYQMALREVRQAERHGLLSADIAAGVRAEYELAIRREHEAIASIERGETAEGAPLDLSDQVREAHRQALVTEKDALLDLRRRGRLSEPSFRQLMGEVDQALAALEKD